MFCTEISILTIHVMDHRKNGIANTLIHIYQLNNSYVEETYLKIRFRFAFLNTQFTPRHDDLKQASGFLQNIKSYIVDFKYRRITHKPLFNQTISNHLSR